MGEWIGDDMVKLRDGDIFKWPWSIQNRVSYSVDTEISAPLCHERANEHGAVSEMKVGPSKSVYRSRLQTAVSCFSPKGCGGERYG